MANQTLRIFRQTHLYFGLFISPALLFFAFTGALQVFSLHEQVAGSSYKPPHWIATLAQIHKNQTTELRHPGAPRSGAGPTDQHTLADAASGGHHHGDHASGAPTPAAPSQPAPFTGPTKRQQHLPLKIFAVLVSLGLLTSTLTGIYMAYMYQRNRLTVTALLVLGIVIPLVLLKF